MHKPAPRKQSPSADRRLAVMTHAQTQPSTLPLALTLILTLLLMLLLALAPGLSGIAAANTRTATSASEAAKDGEELGQILSLPQLAERGQFTQVLETVRAYRTIDKHKSLQMLQQTLELHARHQARRDQAAAEEYRKTLDEVRQSLKADKIEEALFRAIKARGTTRDRKAMLKDPTIVELTKRAEAAAQDAESNARWIEALTIYRSLDLLHEEMNGLYHDHIRLAQQRVLLIRMYAPQAYAVMHVEHLKRQGEEDPETPRLGDVTWQQRLKEINESILHQALVHAARLHVDRAGYEPLITQSLQTIRMILDTPQLAQTFDGLNNPRHVKTFRNEIDQMLAEAKRRGDDMNFIDVRTMTDKVLAVNSNTVKLPSDMLIFEMANGAMMALDEFSSIVWPYESEQFSRTLYGRFYGIGVQIERRDDRLTVASPLEGTPAHGAGIQADDIIARVEGQPTDGWSLNRAVEEITGPKDTYVNISIERRGVRELIDMRIKRAEIQIETVRGWERGDKSGWNYHIDRDSRIGYIRLTGFMPQTRDQVVEAINDMERNGGLGALILDMRGNPGGLLQAAIDVTDIFIERGAIVSIVGPNKSRNITYNARPDRTINYIPLVVLINEGSASASEIVAGAIQDYNRGLIIGSRTFGKGSVQDPYRIDRGNARIKLTTQYYMLPKGRIIHRKPGDLDWGIEPNIIVPVTDQEVIDLAQFRSRVDVLRDRSEDPADAPKPTDILAKGMDPQLETAVLVLKTRMVAQEVAMARLQRDAPTAAQ